VTSLPGVNRMTAYSPQDPEAFKLTREAGNIAQFGIGSSEKANRTHRADVDSVAQYRALVLDSGGLDSATLAHQLKAEGSLGYLLSFDYGQRHGRELDCARQCAAHLGVPHDVIDIRDVGRKLTRSVLTGAGLVPQGYYTEQSMQSTVVPNRNAIFLSIACAIAVENDLNAVAAAMHGGDHATYPDCRPAFIKAFADMQRLALDGIAEVELEAPFLTWRKADIVRLGARLGVPFAQTWSCYRGEEKHCGRCGTCVAPREAFHVAGVEDPTPYTDPHYWTDARRGHAG
jgi:7-cyano-7-deazaguanine synthase